MLRDARHVTWTIAALNVVMRGGSLACRLGLAVYIAHWLGLKATAAYGFTIGAAAVMTALSGLGISYRITRICTTRAAEEAAWRVRDRLIQRLIVQIPLAAASLGFGSIVLGLPEWLSASVVFIVLIEPIVNDLHQAFVYRHRSLAGNTLLFLRSASWIPFVVGLGLANPAWRNVGLVFLGWAAGLALTLIVALALVLPHGAARSGLLRPIDWNWMWQAAVSSPIVYASELGYAGLLYSDRYIVALLLGERSAGIFTLLWSITNATVPIVQGGVFNQTAPRLAALWRRASPREWLVSFDAGMRRTTWLALSSAFATVVAAAAVLPFAHLPRSPENLVMACLMALATVLRMRADLIQHALYSAEQDSDWIAVNILGLILGPALSLAGVAAFGFTGAGIQMVAIGWLLYEMRRRLAKQVVRRARAAVADGIAERWCRKMLVRTGR